MRNEDHGITQKFERSADVLVIGAGLSGLASAYFASRKGLEVIVAGGTSGCRYMSGLLDFLDNLSGFSHDPCDGLSILPSGHPLKRFHPKEIRQTLSSIIGFLTENGLPYENSSNTNSMVVTSAGSFKSSYGYPETMKHGIEAVKNGWPVLIVEFEGMKGFSSSQVSQGLSEFCKATPIRIAFPGARHGAELYPEMMARSLDLPENRIKLAHALLPYVREVKAIGFPSILGIYDSNAVLRDLTDALGVRVFEIPGIPPSVPGLRFEETMINGLKNLGVRFIRNNRVRKLKYESGCYRAEIDNLMLPETIISKGVILATGRFFSKGLMAGIDGVSEPLLGLPVSQPKSRGGWHSRLYFDPEGHALNRAGIETDDFLRPLSANGMPFLKNLHAAGTILSGHDWTREKCGSSLSFATAWKAVESLKMSLDAEKRSSDEINIEITGDHHGHFLFSEAV